MLSVPFHSSTNLLDCIPFKNTKVSTKILIQTHSKKDTKTVGKTYNSSKYGLNKTHVENTQGKQIMKKISALWLTFTTMTHEEIFLETARSIYS